MPADELAHGAFSCCPCQMDNNLQQESGVENRGNNISDALVIPRGDALVFSS